MVPGGTTVDIAHLNIESLWSGGPFADPVSFNIKVTHSLLTPLQSYNGGNKLPSEALATSEAMERIRQTIFSSPTGDINSELIVFLLFASLP